MCTKSNSISTELILEQNWFRKEVKKCVETLELGM